MSTSTLKSRAINAIRALAMDATNKSGDGHPGMPMGAAPMGYVLFHDFMRHNPSNPHWKNRDRYVQSAGHGSTLQYSLLHLTGYAVSMEDIKAHRQWGSITPGHPEVHMTPGVETTTGPLGQGISTAVGMALAEKHLAATYNREGFSLFDHYTYVIASDGDLMEGISGEASSFAGTHKLGKLIVLYDDNEISIDGNTDITFQEDVLARYEAYGWHTQRVEDGQDPEAIHAAVARAKASDKPSIIAVRTIIGYGAAMQDTPKIHGSALSDEQVAEAKRTLGIDWDAFSVPEDVLEHYHEAKSAGEAAEAAWNQLYDAYKAQFPELAAQLEQAYQAHNATFKLPTFETGKKIATRSASHEVINAIASAVSAFVGGSADLAGSNKTTIKGEGFMDAGDFAVRNIHFGVREHAMAAIANGMALHGGIRPYVATFLIFSDYLRPALRLSALMETPVHYVFTHDSIGVGGDGPTHQPVSQLMSLRMIPNVLVLRPADANETAQAWQVMLEQHNRPSVIALSRQNLPVLAVPADSVRKGAYIFADATNPEVILIATGSEVALALEAKQVLDAEGIATRVVSMPSFELFREQSAAYQAEVLPPSISKRVAIEAGTSLGWQQFTGLKGKIISVDTFGASAPGDKVMAEYGFTVDNVVATVKSFGV